MAKASEELIAGLNQALSEELTALFQYLWHHIQGRGIESAAVSEIFKATSMSEMNHAYKLAERIDLLGGAPTLSMVPPKTGGDVRQMIQDDLAAEYAAIKTYKRLIELADDEDDDVTEQMLIGILKDEEEHANQWEGILGQ